VPRRFREVLLLILFIAGTVHAQQWSSDLDDALARSRTERKLIVLHLRADCGRCNAGADEFLRDAETHELCTSAYKSFLLVRADARGATGAVAKLRELRVKLPAVIVLDPSGEIVQEWRRFESGRLAPYAMTLITLRRQTPLLVQGAAFRLAGRATDADFIMARAWWSVRIRTQRANCCGESSMHGAAPATRSACVRRSSISCTRRCSTPAR
jgi:hypothetical protein